jgi:hypothetical protein
MRGMLLCVAALLAVVAAACGGAQEPAVETGGGEVVELGEGDAQAAHAAELPACAAWDSTDADPLLRWLPAFPVERGGAVITFTGMSAQQMEVEATMEMRGMVDYEAVACGSGVVLWVPGLECDGTEQSLVDAVEDDTTMRQYGLDCFRLDEVRPRLAEECALGNVPADRCR